MSDLSEQYMMSSDHEGDVNDFLGFPEPSDNGPKEIESSVTDYIFDKQSDDELDLSEQYMMSSDHEGDVNVESSKTDYRFDKQSDDELDIQNNVEQLNSLPCRAGGKCCFLCDYVKNVDEGNKQTDDDELDINVIRTQLNSLPCKPGGKCCCNTDFSTQVPEYIVDLFNIMPENNIIIVDNDKILYL